MNWVEKYGKMEEQQTIWALFGDMYRYTLNMYRYMLGSGHFWPTCTGTCLHVRHVPVHPVMFFLFRLVFIFYP